MLPLKNMFLLTVGMTLLVLYFVWASQLTEVARRFAHQENVFMCHITLEDSRGIPFTHIASPMPEVYRKASIVPRGVANRRAALNWIRKHAEKGVIYFGDDDNTFDLRLFEEIRDTKKVSMFPVGLIGDYAVSSPVLKEGKVVGFFDSWPSKRKFPVDMAGFAVNVEFLLTHPNATMPYKAGYEEDHFLRSLGLTLEDIEPKADSCTQVFVWHTQTSKREPPTIKIGSQLDTSLKDLLEEITSLGMARVSSSSGVKSYITKDGNTKTL
ncbi:galactosylgalactosylxylosylprotein 3-beta-glucuronosyltransferase S isoform X2 [Cryptotermes secundus]|uniref:galactosylgalactosylxylosylprotein 3-beta-glucuronosyltransferase S isoform X2 n=1 Tax=Cryptotermes secundus TaxID=105785 RepID=UPI001454CC24|nr:galactosylgalactosylxylosylprotein 3-beta-glucuronosyltransferase S isoform X2 [Cryptotermes secundus]